MIVEGLDIFPPLESTNRATDTISILGGSAALAEVAVSFVPMLSKLNSDSIFNFKLLSSSAVKPADSNFEFVSLS